MDNLRLTKERVQGTVDFEAVWTAFGDNYYSRLEKDWLTLHAEVEKQAERIKLADAIIETCEKVLSNPINDTELCETIVACREWKEEQK